MQHLLNERHRAIISLCDAMCLERERKISSEIHFLCSRKCVIRGIMDTVHAVSNWQLEKRIVSSCIWEAKFLKFFNFLLKYK